MKRAQKKRIKKLAKKWIKEEVNKESMPIEIRGVRIKVRKTK